MLQRIGRNGLFHVDLLHGLLGEHHAVHGPGLGLGDLEGEGGAELAGGLHEAARAARAAANRRVILFIVFE